MVVSKNLAPCFIELIFRNGLTIGEQKALKA